MKGTFLPLGASDFATLRSADMIYVDKTALVHGLASTPKGKFFLSRPRRFGKSLLISTFESLFKNGLEDFKGLAIDGLWKDTTYRVVHIDFSEAEKIQNFSEFTKDCDDLIADAFSAVGFERSLASRSSLIRQLSKWLKGQPGTSLVLLIDEYDAPLTQCLDRPELFDQVRDYLSGFYGIIKANDACWRLVFITGIAKFAKMSIFSAMNNLEDISLNPEYGALLGYTEEEIRHYFATYIDNAVGKVKEAEDLDREEVLEKLKEQYDGFCFDEDASVQVYAPWSTLNFFKYPSRGFKNYWYDSAGQPRMLQAYFKNHSFTDPSNYSKDKFVAMSSLQLSSGVEDVSELALMAHAGYLTIKNVTPSGVALGYPNEEVAEAIAQLYSNNLLSNKTLLDVGVPDINGILLKGPAENIVQTLNKIFAGINYNFYKRDIVEEDVRAICQVLFKGAKMLPHIEHPNSEGRSDLEVTVGDRRLVFEFKVQAPRRSAKTLLAQAVKQLALKEYGKDSFQRHLTRIALVFSRTKHRFVAWQEVST